MRQRYHSMDALRGLAILAVLMIHITSSYVGSSYSAMFLNQISRFAVPTFLVLSGWGLTISGRISVNFWKYIWKQAKKLLIPYFLWSIAYWLWNMKAIFRLEV